MSLSQPVNKVLTINLDFKRHWFWKSEVIVKLSHGPSIPGHGETSTTWLSLSRLRS